MVDSRQRVIPNVHFISVWIAAENFLADDINCHGIAWPNVVPYVHWTRWRELVPSPIVAVVIRTASYGAVLSGITPCLNQTTDTLASATSGTTNLVYQTCPNPQIAVVPRAGAARVVSSGNRPTRCNFVSWDSVASTTASKELVPRTSLRVTRCPCTGRI